MRRMGWVLTAGLAFGLTTASRAEEAPAPPVEGPSSGPSAKGPHHVYLVGNLLVTQPRLTFDPDTPDQASAVFTIQNRGESADRLVGATTERADRVVLDPHGTGDGSLVIPPRQTVTLSREGAHLLVQGLHGDVRPAGSIPGVLTFERAGPLHMTFGTSDAAPPT